MRRASDLIPRIADPDNLRLASWKAAKGKRYASAVLDYQRHLDRNLLHLREQILSGQVVVGAYRYFKVYEPKERQICASAFREQVLHHALMNVCHDYFERAQVFDSYASRKGKGTYAALERAKTYTNRHTWFLKLDVRKFFDSMHHDVMKRQLNRLFKEERLLLILTAIIDSYAAQPDRGVPIGNLTSQYFANHYLSELDHFIKERLSVRAYVRYMDDMVLWHDDKAALKDALGEIWRYLSERLRCDLKPIVLNRCKTGLPFLGYHVFPHHVGLLQKSKARFLRKLRYISDRYHDGSWNETTCARHARPLIAFTEHADVKALRKNALERFGYW